MASRTKGGGLTKLALLLIIVAFAATGGLAGVGKVMDWLKTTAEEVTGGDLIAAPEVVERLEQCRPGEPISDDDCGDLKFVVLDAKKMPFIALNIKTAWDEGRPGILTRGDEATIKANRKVTCNGFKHAYPGGSCDEYPFASSHEGGAGARIAEVPGRENSCQGGTLNGQYRRHGIEYEQQFGVLLRNPAIAQQPFTGTDIAKEQGQCA